MRSIDDQSARQGIYNFKPDAGSRLSLVRVTTSRVEKIARAICQETCAFYGEPPCWQTPIAPDMQPAWPNPICNEPGCMALAIAADMAIGKQEAAK
jgi:hypothetical protein